jgi:hypothetical protein
VDLDPDPAFQARIRKQSGSRVLIRVADPDPYPDPDWIRIQSGQWIRIRNPDPDPGGQNDLQKWEKNFLS